MNERWEPISWRPGQSHPRIDSVWRGVRSNGHGGFEGLRWAGGWPSIDERIQGQLLLIRVILGLNPAHDPVECVRVLYEEGREAFEKLRGEPCAHAAEWRP